MDGSEDPFYRYTMPTLTIKVEGTTKMIKTQLTNVEAVAQAVGRPADCTSLLNPLFALLVVLFALLIPFLTPWRRVLRLLEPFDCWYSDSDCLDVVHDVRSLATQS
jgi:hypothetical protein